MPAHSQAYRYRHGHSYHTLFRNICALHIKVHLQEIIMSASEYVLNFKAANYQLINKQAEQVNT